ncbi:MAG: hypothetical protein A2138_10310 [Deltaproteobacteria bacterium RBG_16_71_12]|nr:MAG: hypothetical protein A2138_10310 [Deltaproteobacteria bacterium RBG_16_71_12]
MLDSVGSTQGLDLELIRNLDQLAVRGELTDIGARLAQQDQSDGDLGTALWVLGRRLELHARFRERRLFPALAARRRGDRALFEAWAFDALKLFGAIDLVRKRCRYTDVAPDVLDAIERLVRRAQDQLSAEAGVIAPWSGVGSS